MFSSAWILVSLSLVVPASCPDLAAANIVAVAVAIVDVAANVLGYIATVETRTS